MLIEEPCRNLAFIMIMITSPFTAVEHFHARGTCPGCGLKDGFKRIEEPIPTMPCCPPHDDEEMELASIYAVEEEEEEEKPNKRKRRNDA